MIGEGQSLRTVQSACRSLVKLDLRFRDVLEELGHLVHQGLVEVVQEVADVPDALPLQRPHRLQQPLAMGRAALHHLLPLLVHPVQEMASVGAGLGPGPDPHLRGGGGGRQGGFAHAGRLAEDEGLEDGEVWTGGAGEPVDVGQGGAGGLQGGHVAAHGQQLTAQADAAVLVPQDLQHAAHSQLA